MAELKMEVILKAFDHVTATLRGIDGTIGKTKQNISDYKKRIRDLSTGIPLNGPLTRQQQRDQQELEKTNRMIERQQKRLKDLYKMQAHRNSGKELIGAGAVQMAAASAMGYGVSRFMAEGMDFEETMSRVQALTRLEKDSPMLAALNENAKYLGATTWADPKQVAEGQAFYAMAGFKPEEIMKSMAGTLDLARAGGVDIGRAADIGSNILSAFGLDANQMDRVGDILVGTFTRTNTNLEMLGETMKYVGPIAKGLGISLEEASAMAGVLGNVGIQGGEAGTAMRAIFSRLAAGPSMAKKELQKLGIATTDKKGDLRKPMELFTEMLEKTAKMGNAERMKALTSIAGLEAASALSALMDKGSIDDLKQILQEIKDNNGESKKLAKIMADNLSGDIQELDSAWSDFKITVFETNSKGLRGSFQWITKIMNVVGEFAKQNPEMVSNLSYITAGIIGITASLGLAKLAWGAFQFAVLGNPIAAALAVISLSIYAIYKNLDKWLWLWTDGFGQLQMDIDGLLRSVPLIGNHLGNMWLILSNGVKTVVDSLGFLVDLVFDFDNAWLKVVDTWDDLSANAKRFWSDIVTWAQPAIDQIMKILQPFLDAYYAIVGKPNTELANDMYKNAQIEERYGISANDFYTKTPDEQAAMLHGRAESNLSAEEQRAEVMRMMAGGNNSPVNNTQNQSFEIHITAPDGNAQSIAQAVQRGIASVTKKDSALLGDLR